jgi:hypothetical protein
MPYQPFDHPAAWKGADIASKDDIAFDLERRHIDALSRQAESGRKSNLGDADISPETFPLDDIAEDIANWRQEIISGRGVQMLRGFPVGQVDHDDLRMMYLGLGTHFGRPVSQSSMGDLIGDVVNVGGLDRNERAYRSRRALNLHTDRCDHLGMLCVQKAIEGGISTYASALAIHNEILATKPELVEPLYRGYFHHLFGEQPEGEPPVTRERIPILSVTDGIPCVIYIRGYIDLAVEEGHVTLSDVELAAIDYFDEIADRPDIRFDFLMEPGDASFVNNCYLLHTRNQFEDSDDPPLKRHLMRLWLTEDGRPASDGVLMHKGRQGIVKREGKGTYYQQGAA